jgi:hypothetical protein
MMVLNLDNFDDSQLSNNAKNNRVVPLLLYIVNRVSDTEETDYR